MDTLDFLRRVLPSEGYYFSITIDGESTRQTSYETIEELADGVQKLSKRGKNTYYAISSFKTDENRRQANVLSTKVVALDIDCGAGKPFPSWREGLVALGDFISKHKLPKPMVVRSGNGLHVYWVLTKPCTPDEWKPLAVGLKNAASESGFDIDQKVTADSARVLRPVKTVHPNGVEVQLVIDAAPVEYDSLANILSIRKEHTPKNNLLQALGVKTDFPPANGSVVVAKCKQLQQATSNQKDVSEPMWYTVLGIAAYCHDPESTALKWSERHPDYEPSATLSKMEQWRAATTGPATCANFESINPTGCKDCPFKGKISTPVRLGLQYVEAPPPVSVPDQIAANTPVPVPFKRTTSGMKVTISDVDIDVCKFDIYPVSYGRDETLGYEVVRYHWNRPHVGWQELKLRQALLTDGHRDFATCIADQGIVLNGRKQTEYFQLMLRSYMDELRHKRSMTNIHTTMGWKDNFTKFVIGDTVYKRELDGTVVEEKITLASTSQRLGNDLYETSGTLEDAVAFTSVLEKLDLRGHMFVLGVSLSSVLYAFSGLKGVTISLCGKTGAGKTLAQLWAQSLWGNPEKLHFTAKFTLNALFNRMGFGCHLPMTVDEATMVPDKEAGEYLYWVSQGRDKARLNRNAEERDAKVWAAPNIISTNLPWQGKLISSGMETDAQQARLLELHFTTGKMFSRDSSSGKKMHHFLMNNYGLIGREYVRNLLGLGPDGIRAMLAEFNETFTKRYKARFSGEERYYETTIILADVGLQIAKQWNLIAFDAEKPIEWALTQVGAIRRVLAENKMDAFDLLSQYFNANAEYAVTVMHTGAKAAPNFSRMPRGEIRVRYDVYRNSASESFDRGTVMMDRTHFRKWLAARGGDYKGLIEELTSESAIATPRSSKAYLGRDTDIKLGQVYVLGVNLKHPRLCGIIDDAEQAYEDMVYSQIKSVSS